MFRHGDGTIQLAEFPLGNLPGMLTDEDVNDFQRYINKSKRTKWNGIPNISNQDIYFYEFIFCDPDDQNSSDKFQGCHFAVKLSHQA